MRNLWRDCYCRTWQENRSGGREGALEEKEVDVERFAMNYMVRG